MSLRGVIFVLGVSVLCAATAQGSGGPITRIVAPYAAGGTADFLARQYAERLQPILGGSVVVENRPGANGMVGSQHVARSAPDGLTLLMPGPSVVVINPHVYKGAGFDPMKELTPIANLTLSASALLVASNLPVNDVRGFIAWARTQGRPVRFGSAGAGGVSHLWIELFAGATKADTQHIPYKSVAQATTDVLGGQIDGQFSDVAPHIPMVRAGRMKMLGLIGQQRNAAMPDVPTFAEQGFSGMDGISRYGVFTAADTPAAIVTRLADAFAKTMQDPKFVRVLADYGMAADYIGPAEFGKVLRQDSQWWGKVVETYKVKAD